MMTRLLEKKWTAKGEQAENCVDEVREREKRRK